MNWHGYPINGWGVRLMAIGMFTFLGLMTTGAVLLAADPAVPTVLRSHSSKLGPERILADRFGRAP